MSVLTTRTQLTPLTLLLSAYLGHSLTSGGQQQPGLPLPANSYCRTPERQCIRHLHLTYRLPLCQGTRDSKVPSLGGAACQSL